MTKKTNTYEAPASETYSIENEGIICLTRPSSESGGTEGEEVL